MNAADPSDSEDSENGVLDEDQYIGPHDLEPLFEGLKDGNLKKFGSVMYRNTHL